MTFATTDRTNLRLLWETQWGSTPASGVTREMNITSHSFQVKKNTVKSNTIRDDRMVADIIETEMMSDGSVNFEFQAGGADDMWQAFVLGTWTRPMTFDFWQGTIVSWIANNKIAVVGPDATGYLTVGRRLKTSGFVNPVNNGFRQIASMTYNSGAGQTEITFSSTTAIVEAGNAKSTVADANDVVVLNSTVIRSGTAGAASFDSNSGNAFASARAAGQLNVGQRVHVEGLGYESGTVTFAAVAVAGSTVTVNDGVNSVTLTAGTDFAVGATATTSATNLAAAVNSARINGFGSPLVFVNVNAVSLVGAVTFTNLNATGGALSKTEAGTNITVVNFSGGDTSQHGVYTITALTDDSIFVSPTPTTNANAGSLPVTVRGSMLRNPGVSANIIPQSATVEAGFEDVGKHASMNGQMVSAISLDFNASAVLTGTAEFMGKATTVYDGTKLGTTPYTVLGAVNTEFMNATADVGTILKNGVALSTALKQIKMDGKAQLRNQMAVSSKFPVGIGTGRFELTGTMQAYFENWDLLNNLLNHDTVSLAWNVFDNAKHTYYFTVPAVKITADPVNSKGIDQDVMEEITWEAFRDPTTACMLQIDRFSSLLPV
jgi:hypothetical protein